MIFPYLGSILWYRDYLKSLMAAEMPKGFAAQHSLVQLTRTELRPEGRERIQLKVPLAGGSHACKTTHPKSWMVSDHGRWPLVHLGALNAAYSQTPFYAHFIDSLTPLIEKAPEKAFAEFSAQVNKWVEDSISLRENIEGLRNLNPEHQEIIRRRAHDMEKRIDPHTTIAESIFRFGRETIFLLYSPLFEKSPNCLTNTED
ncbi:MAG: WbqC family protein [Clostridium sp.]|nr:WbqC family protein [Prevotella sp.]MCM1429771.1 WbqC family protein [Clostridium sp.]MCM1476059.1 WbqC family protein [Muribaculaceae bacterium]